MPAIGNSEPDPSLIAAPGTVLKTAICLGEMLLPSPATLLLPVTGAASLLYALAPPRSQPWPWWMGNELQTCSEASGGRCPEQTQPESPVLAKGMEICEGEHAHWDPADGSCPVYWGVRHALLLFGFLVGEPVLPILQMKVGRDDSTTTLIPWLLS